MVPTNFFQADDEVNPLHDACKRGILDNCKMAKKF